MKQHGELGVIVVNSNLPLQNALSIGTRDGTNVEQTFFLEQFLPLLYRSAEDNRFERLTASKSAFVETVQRLWQRDLPQSGAIAKGVVCDTNHGIGNEDFSQRRATAKRSPSDLRHAVAKRTWAERSTAVKGIRADLSRTVSEMRS